MNPHVTSRNEHAVVLCCDAEHLPFATFVAHRINQIEPQRSFDIIICIPEGVAKPAYISEEVAKIFHLNVENLKGLKLQRKWISNATFFRILLPEIFRHRYKKLLYLDTDTYPRRPCIQKLFDEVPDDLPLSASLEPTQYVSRRQDRAREVTLARSRLLGAADGRYFNAGVLLIAPGPFIRANGVDRFWDAYEKNLEIISNFGEQDQGALNKAFANEMGEISPLYNWHTGALLNPTMVSTFDPAILHFAGRYKPWNVNDDPYLTSFRDEYISFFSSHGISFNLKPAIDSYAYRLQNPKYRNKIVNWISSRMYLRRRVRHQHRNEFEDQGFRRNGVEAMIAQAQYGRFV